MANLHASADDALLQDSVGPEVYKETAPAIRGVGYWGWRREPFAKGAPDKRARPPSIINLMHFAHIPLFKFH